MASAGNCMENIPKGGYSRLKWLRFSMVIFALLDATAHLFASPGATSEVTFWIELEVTVYIVIGVIYLLGLRSWYTPAILFSVLNIILFFVSGVSAIPGINPTALSGHVELFQYSFGRAFSVIGWLYLIIMGLVLNRIDRGSKIDEMLNK